MKTVSSGIWFFLCLACKVAGLTEHKVHNIVLYPDKHSWCKTTGIKQIVAYPGCSSIEIDNNVCVGACFSYSIPRTMPSAPGEVITPYCDSCQPVDYQWKEVTLTCTDESEEEEGLTQMTKKVQVITNCTCTSCEKQYELKKASDQQNHTGSKSSDVPELMSLMMETHHTRSQVKVGKENEEEEEEEEEEVDEDVTQRNEEKKMTSTENNLDKENLIDDDEDEEEEEKPAKMEKPLEGIEILHVNKELLDVAKAEHKHYEIGPHHSIVLKPDVVETNKEPTEKHHKHEDDNEETPSLLANQFKIHDNEEYLDQIAVETIKKETSEQKILTVPHLIYKTKENGSTETEEKESSEKWTNGVRMLEVPHHDLQPAVEGAQMSYFGKSEPKAQKSHE